MSGLTLNNLNEEKHYKKLSILLAVTNNKSDCLVKITYEWRRNCNFQRHKKHASGAKYTVNVRNERFFIELTWIYSNKAALIVITSLTSYTDVIWFRIRPELEEKCNQDKKVVNPKCHIICWTSFFGKSNYRCECKG